MFPHLANVGDAKSLVIHPASTTHSRMSEEDLAAAGIGAGTIRLSVGLEGSADLIADLERGLQAASRTLGKWEAKMDIPISASPPGCIPADAASTPICRRWC